MKKKNTYNTKVLQYTLLINFLLIINSNLLQAKEDYTLSLQYRSMTSNAGGQQAYALRLSHNDQGEILLFSNLFLLTGRWPLTGVAYDWRFVICSRDCFVRSFFQMGAGATTAGPLIELLWSITPLWLFRIDVVTHFYFSQLKPIFWNYPLWIGFSVPF
ncbi:MAG: hypothetical protein AB8G05_20465 [Oligoflexales bacterium]